jgi:hypothetical protein
MVRNSMKFRESGGAESKGLRKKLDRSYKVTSVTAIQLINGDLTRSKRHNDGTGETRCGRSFQMPAVDNQAQRPRTPSVFGIWMSETASGASY